MGKINAKKTSLLASKKDKLRKMRKRKDDKVHKKRKVSLRTKKVKKIDKKEKKKVKKQEIDEPIIEHFPSDDYMNLNNQVEISKEDEKILEQFQVNVENFNEEMEELAEKLQEKIDQNLENKKQADIKENILNDPDVKLVYSDIAKIMKEYTSGKIAKPFKAIPLLDHWEAVLQMTKPEEWSPHAMFAATRLFASSLDVYRAKTFYEKYLLPAVREDIKKNKKLNYHYYQALIKAFYKPAAWFKGILFPLCKSNNCTIKEAQIFGSILSKLSIPVTHSSVALVKIAELGFTGPTAIFIKTLLEKKYALPTRVLNALVNYFLKYDNTDIVLPVIFYQLILRVCNLYSGSMDEMQKAAVKSLVRKKKHEILTPLILNAIDNVSKEDIADQNIKKSLAQKQNEMILE